MINADDAPEDISNTTPEPADENREELAEAFGTKPFKKRKVPWLERPRNQKTVFLLILLVALSTLFYYTRSLKRETRRQLKRAKQERRQIGNELRESQQELRRLKMQARCFPWAAQRAIRGLGQLAKIERSKKSLNSTESAELKQMEFTLEIALAICPDIEDGFWREVENPKLSEDFSKIVNTVRESRLDPKNVVMLEQIAPLLKDAQKHRLLLQTHRPSPQYLKPKIQKGDATAMFQMGRCYEHGQGVWPDIDKAVYWYRRAAATGSTEAKKYIDEYVRHWTAYDKYR